MSDQKLVKPNNKEEKKVLTSSGIEVKTDYAAKESGIEHPGEYPFTRGVYKSMYRGRLWTMRQYAGFSTAEESNRRYKYLLSQGTTGLSVAFDLPTQIGYDSDHEFSEGEVGKVGVAIDSLEDIELLFKDITLEKISTSMTINSTAYILLAFYIALAKKQGANLKNISGTIQNDILKEYAARGTYIYPPGPSMRLITDVFEYCSEELPKWNTISVSGYHMREAGSTAVQELAFTLANGKAYLEAAIKKRLDIDKFAKRVSFFFNAHNDFFEEIAKYRAARRMWAKITSDLGAKDQKSKMLRFHTQTAGSTLTAQQPMNNISRVSLQALSAVMGGTQSLHTNGFDEALSLPSAEAATLALRSQQIIAFESGVVNSADPLAGSYFVENLTDQVEEEAWKYIDKIDKMGGAVQAIQEGYMQNEIAISAYKYQREIEDGSRTIVGMNKYVDENEAEPQALFHVNDSIRQDQIEKLRKLKQKRDARKVKEILKKLSLAVTEETNVMPIVIDAVENYATLGEISDVLRDVYGEYRP